jgi:hypothetical protein
MRRALLVVACLTLASRAGVGQAAMTSAIDSAGNACVVLNGIRIGADWGDSVSGARPDSSNRRGSVRLGGGATIDTTLDFNVTDQRWSRSSLTAYVAGGVSGQTRNATIANDPRTRWHACVGITLAMQRPTLVMRGVHGQMHLKIDLTPLTRIPGATLGDSTRQNQVRR